MSKNEELTNRQPVLGQAWCSEVEPELGIGIVTKLGFKQLEVTFKQIVRCYSMVNAPLSRLSLKVGDSIKIKDGRTLCIDALVLKEGLRYCQGAQTLVVESDIISMVSTKTTVEDALWRADFSPTELGQLRVDTLYTKRHAQISASSGWAGGRVSLIAHQLNTAKAIVESMPGRFWLADEVGLGKTITAGLALHQLCLTERLEHVLILVPDALIIQWFIELYRKFNLPFSLLNDYFTEDEPPAQFWDKHKFCLSSHEFVASSSILQNSLLQTKWDLLIFDEVHHLPTMANYSSFYLPLVDKTASCFFLSAGVDELPAPLMGDSSRTFRNTRDQIPLFPKRVPHIVALECVDSREKLAQEFLADVNLQADHQEYYFRKDSRILWLIDILRQKVSEKFLLITHTKTKAIALQNALRENANIKTALFHEGMTLVARDRMAAYFAESEQAQLLICSEIGSEGRNFQFCHNLILFDYPLSLDLLEQRIGRIDRIGQTTDINIYLPYVVGTPQEFVVRWLAEGIGLFLAPCRLGDHFLALFRTKLLGIAAELNDTKLEDLIQQTWQAKEKALTEKKTVVFQVALPAEELLGAIQRADKSLKLEQWLTELLEYFQVEIEDVAPRTLLLRSGHSLFEALPDANALLHPFTFSRQQALYREDYHFLTVDHPLLENAFSLLLSSSEGRCSASYWPDKKLPHSTLYLEATYIVESEEASTGAVVRVIVDERCSVRRIPLTTLKKNLVEGPLDTFRQLVKTNKNILLKMLCKTKQEAEKIPQQDNKLVNLQLDMVRLIIRA